MRDIFLVLVLLAFLFGSFRYPYFMVLGYIWVDFLQPQRMGYYIFNQLPVAMILGVGALVAYLVLDRNKKLLIDPLQVLVTLLVAYAALATLVWGEVDGTGKLDWVAKALLFSVFIPFVLTSRVRIEVTLAVLIFSISAITISGGLKTLMGGGGYGTLSLLVNNNTGLFEGSTLATVSCALIPLVWWFYKHNSLVPQSRVTFVLFAGITASFVLIIIGSEARTGLVALAALVFLVWLRTNRKIVTACVFLLIGLISLPFVPSSFLERMATITDYRSDQSASIRVGVWKWTLQYVSNNPLGGGFDVYKLNNLTLEVLNQTDTASGTDTQVQIVQESARAFHSSYFEVLGELGYPGFAIWSCLLILFYLKSRKLRTAKDTNLDHRADFAPAEWYSDFGKAVGTFLIVYMVGSLTIGIAFNAAFYDVLAICIAVGNLRVAHLAALSSRTAAKSVGKPGSAQRKNRGLPTGPPIAGASG